MLLLSFRERFWRSSCNCSVRHFFKASVELNASTVPKIARLPRYFLFSFGVPLQANSDVVWLLNTMVKGVPNASLPTTTTNAEEGSAVREHLGEGICTADRFLEQQFGYRTSLAYQLKDCAAEVSFDAVTDL